MTAKQTQKNVAGNALTLMGKTGKVRPITAPKSARLETTKGTADVVVVPRARFEEIEELLEDRAAEAAYRRTRDEESFPAEVADRLMSGDSPVRVFREYRGMKAAALAERVGKSPSYPHKRTLRTVLNGIARDPKYRHNNLRLQRASKIT